MTFVTFWMVAVEGKPGLSHRHPSKEVACNEAKRLAEQQGRTAYVLEAIGAYEIIIPTSQWVSL